MAGGLFITKRMDKETIIGILTILCTGLLGKEAWGFWTRRQELTSEKDIRKIEIESEQDIMRIQIENDKKCREKIMIIEAERAADKLRINQIVTGVDMMLTMMEDEFGDEAKYVNVIKKVREYINGKVDE